MDLSTATADIIPLVDSENPLYCPTVSANQYIIGVRLVHESAGNSTRFSFFHRLCDAFESGQLKIPSSYVKRSAKTPFLYSQDAIDHRFQKSSPSNKRATSSESASAGGDFYRPAKKFCKRSPSQHESSFVLSSKVDRLWFPQADNIEDIASGSDSDCNEQTQKLLDNVFRLEDPCLGEGLYLELVAIVRDCKRLRDQYRGPNLGPETPKSIAMAINLLDSLIPGIRLEQQLGHTGIVHQDIINFLGLKGHLNSRTLELFRNANVLSMNLTESMANMDGLNLLRNDTLKVFKQPNSFEQLRSLTLSDVDLMDDDLMHLGSLRLESLFLDNTQIGSEAVMHLVALKYTLAYLELSWNERIDDDAIPSLSSLTKLRFLSLRGTNVSIKGVRKIACTVWDRSTEIGLVLPSECEKYMFGLDSEYEMNVASPFVHDPAVCVRLTLAQLKENLSVHAARNPSIRVDGSKRELAKQLARILDRRKKDMIVRKFMLQGF